MVRKIDDLTRIVWFLGYSLNRVSKYLSWKVLRTIYKQTILPSVDYGCMVWGDCGKQNTLHLECVQNQAMRIILGANRRTCTQFMRSKLMVLSLSSRKRFMRLQLAYKTLTT